jgi:pimeloyl-ACP methyl ester carboxylesterase
MFATRLVAPNAAPRTARARSRFEVAFGRIARLANGALREAWCSARSQPLIPLYYFVGSMGGRCGGTPVILVHGYGQNCAAFRVMAAALSARGVGPIHAFNYPWFADMRDNAERLRRRIERVVGERGAAQVDIVAHSMGGIIVMEYLRSYASVSRVRRCVTIASPHGGLSWRNPVPGPASAQLQRGCEYLLELATVRVTVPTMSIASNADLIAHPASACSLASRGGRHVTVRHAGHLSLLFSERISRLVAGFLRRDDSRIAAGIRRSRSSEPESA